MAKINRHEYIIAGLIQASLIAIVQYIYNEIDQDIGSILMMTPLTLLNSTHIPNNTIKEYTRSYTLASFFSASMGLIYYILQEKLRSRIRAYTILVISAVFSILLYIIYIKRT